MALQIKSMYTILKDLIDWTTARTDKLTDFNIGSGIRTLYEAVSVQLEEFYFRMKQNALYAIATSIYTSFGFDRKSANYATGQVMIAFVRPLPANLIIPAGTILTTSDVYGYIAFEVVEDTTAETGMTSIPVNVKCTQPGTVGNVPEGAISTIVVTNPIIRSVYNLAAFTNGTNAETAVEHKKRFQHYINTLAKATSNAILYGTLEVEGVSGAWVDDNYIGYAKVYAHNSDGELPDSLRTSILNHLVNYRAAGIEIEVLPIIKVPIDQNIKVMIADDYDTEQYSTLIRNVVVNFLNDYTVGNSYHESDIVHFIRASYEDVVINVVVINGSDISLNMNQIVRPGNITIECVNKQNWVY